MDERLEPEGSAYFRSLSSSDQLRRPSASDHARAAAIGPLLFSADGRPRTPTRAEWQEVMDTFVDSQGSPKSVHFWVFRELAGWVYWRWIGDQFRFDPFREERYPEKLFYDLFVEPAFPNKPNHLKWEMIAYLVRTGCDEAGYVHREHVRYFTDRVPWTG